MSQQDVQPRMGEPVEGLTVLETRLFVRGKEVFDEPLLDTEGLGPIFNDISCGNCHALPDVGGSGTTTVTRFGRAATMQTPFDDLAGLGGSLLQVQAISAMCLEFVPPQANVIAKRLTPIALGTGLLENVPDADIIANEQNQPPGLNGFVHMVPLLEDMNAPLRVGKFGWKGVVATTMTFSIDASLNEMGLTSAVLPVENAPNGDLTLLGQCDSVADPEDQPDAEGFTLIERFTHFQRFSAAPPQTPRSGMTGEALFDQIGCADCHVPTWTTGQAPEAALSNVEIHPYTDFLLHDMGALGDGIVQGDAEEVHMMTRALWGLTHRVSMLHDGRATGGTFADNVRASIQDHDGEGAASNAAFFALMPAEQDQVIDFLASLGQAEFDFENDNDLDEFDWFFMEGWFNGPVQAYGPDDDEAIADIDQDGDFDLRDWGLLQRGFTGDGGGAIGPGGPSAASELNLSATALGGKNAITVPAGAAVDYQVIGVLSDADNRGLAMFTFDLSFDGGDLIQANAPTLAPMTNFATPDGINNPAGYGGTVINGDLIQVGGAQNTIKNSFASQPTGTTILDLAIPLHREILVEGSLTAPSTPGVYTLRIQNALASVVRSDATGIPFWVVEAAEAGEVKDLVITVVDCNPAAYCTAKVNSQGCTPAIGSTGAATLSGADDFHVTATDVINQEMGLMFWGHAEGNTPMFGGTLCISGPLVRTPVLTTGGSPTGVDCTGQLDHHFTQADMAAFGFDVGTTVYSQFFYRDPTHPDGTGIGMTNGLEFTVCP